VSSESGADHSDNAHDNLCCGTPYCTDPGACVTHDAPKPSRESMVRDMEAGIAD
jgi:hypothetical protein